MKNKSFKIAIIALIVLVSIILGVSVYYAFAETANNTEKVSSYTPSTAEEAKYVPTYLKTTDNLLVQNVYNPYTADLALDLCKSAEQVGNNNEAVSRMEKLGYSQVHVVENSALYQMGTVTEEKQDENGNLIQVTSEKMFSALNGVVGMKEITYNGKTKYAFAVAFRGTNTSDLADLLADVNIIINSKGLHSGFSANATDFYDSCQSIEFFIDGSYVPFSRIIEDMKNEDSDYCLLVTGHSLGGAITDCFVGSNLYDAGVYPGNVVAYTFAAPKSANSAYNYKYTNIYNFVNSDDWVPTVGASKRIGTDFVFIPDDTFREAHYGEHYVAGHTSAWWTNFVDTMSTEFIAHMLKTVYAPVTDYISDNITKYTNYNTSDINNWDKSIIINQNCFGNYKQAITSKYTSLKNCIFFADMLTSGSLYMDNVIIETNSEIDAQYISVAGNSCKIIGNLNNYWISNTIRELTIIEFNEGYLHVTGDCKLGSNNVLGSISMTHNTDYLLVDGDFTIGYYYNSGYNSSSNGRYTLNAGTVELKGDFIQNGTRNSSGFSSDWPSSYYESGTHKTIFSGEKTQTISFARYSGGFNQFANLILENTDICFATPIYQLTLCEDTTITNSQALSVYTTLDLNGYTLTTAGDVTADSLRTNGGNLSVGSTVNTATVNISGNASKITGSLTATGTVTFNEGKLEVTGDCKLGSGGKSGRLSMTHDADYLLVDGNFTIGYEVGSASSTLTAGTVEVKGDFTQNYSYNSSTYYETNTHKTILSGTETQKVSFAYYKSRYNQFANLILENTDICFATPIYQLTLCEDTTITNSQALSVYTTLDLNGYTLTTAGDVTADSLRTNSGNFNTNGNLTVTNGVVFSKNNIAVKGNLSAKYIRMTNSEDILDINGNLLITGGDSTTSYLTDGKIYCAGNFTTSSSYSYSYNESGNHMTILDGDFLQTVKLGKPSSYEKFSTLVLNNDSEDGVVFLNNISVTRLFNHNQCNFTLYNNGSGSSFVDFDEDGLQDNVDRYPIDADNQLGDGKVDVLMLQIEPIENQLYTGAKEYSPRLVVKHNDVLLEENVDYTTTYSNNTYTGTASVRIKGINSYIGTATYYYTIYCNHNYLTKITKPSCTEQGYTTHTCKICKNTYKDSYTKPLGHEYIIAVSTEPNCTVSGYDIYSCTRCYNNYINYTSDALGHKYKYNFLNDNSEFVYICEDCDYETTQTADDLLIIWDEKYINKTPNRNKLDESCYLDVVSDGIINAKDYAKIHHISKYGY